MSDDSETFRLLGSERDSFARVIAREILDGRICSPSLLRDFALADDLHAKAADHLRHSLMSEDL